MPCEATVRSVINVPLDYEMRLEEGLDATDATDILYSQVDPAIANHAKNFFATDCSKGILRVLPGYSDYIDATATTCELGGNCYACKGYVIVQYNPDILTAKGATDAVFSSIASGMDNSVGRTVGVDGTISSSLTGVEAIGMPMSTYVGGVRAQEMSNTAPRGGLSPGGKAGISILCLTLFALLVALVVRRKKRNDGWKEGEEDEGVERTLDEYNCSKLQMMKEIDNVVADLDGAPTQDTADAASVAESESVASVDKPARFPVDGESQKRAQNGEEGFEVSMMC